MGSTTIIINKLNKDRIIEIIISENRYIVFTILHRNLIIIDATYKDALILLCNRKYMSHEDLMGAMDDIIIMASKVDDNDDFICNMDTYIDLNNGICNDTTKEIIAICKIILDDY